MALHLNLLHEEILELRQRQRDPLKIGMLVLSSCGALLFLYYAWNAYQTLEIKSKLSSIEAEWKKLEPVETAASIGGTTVPMSRYILSVTFNPNAAKPAATPAAGRRKAKNKDE